MSRGPPAGVQPARLFRLLLGRPRPALPLRFRARAAPSTPLHVRALTALEERTCLDAVEGVEPREAWAARLGLHLLAASLWTPVGLAFPGGAEEAGELGEDEGDALMGETLAALDVVSPSYARSDVDAWSVALEKGARDGSSARLAWLAGGAVDVALGYGARSTTPRPDRYFGLPLAELTDGHLMAYAAARSFVASLSR